MTDLGGSLPPGSATTPREEGVAPHPWSEDLYGLLEGFGLPREAIEKAVEAFNRALENQGPQAVTVADLLCAQCEISFPRPGVVEAVKRYYPTAADAGEEEGPPWGEGATVEEAVVAALNNLAHRLDHPVLNDVFDAFPPDFAPGEEGEKKIREIINRIPRAVVYPSAPPRATVAS